MKRLAEKQVNQMLMSHGLGKLDDPGLIPQLGFLVQMIIKTHEQFRELINRCESSKRPAMYEALRPYVRAFELKPLDVYIAELADLAERKQLPIQNPDGTLSEFKVPEIHVDRAQRPPTGLCAPTTHADEPAVLMPRSGMPLCGLSDAKTQENRLAQELCEGAVLSHFLELTCASCTYYERFAGWNKQSCIDKARVEGWRAVTNKERGEDAELCPACLDRYWPSLK